MFILLYNVNKIITLLTLFFPLFVLHFIVEKIIYQHALLKKCHISNVIGRVNKNSAEGVIAPAGAKVTGATIRTWLLNKFISFLAVQKSQEPQSERGY